MQDMKVKDSSFGEKEKRIAIPWIAIQMPKESFKANHFISFGKKYICMRIVPDIINKPKTTKHVDKKRNGHPWSISLTSCFDFNPKYLLIWPILVKINLLSSLSLQFKLGKEELLMVFLITYPVLNDSKTNQYPITTAIGSSLHEAIQVMLKPRNKIMENHFRSLATFSKRIVFVIFSSLACVIRFFSLSFVIGVLSSPSSLSTILIVYAMFSPMNFIPWWSVWSQNMKYFGQYQWRFQTPQY